MKRGFGRFGLQLTAAFIVLAVASVAIALAITGLAVNHYEAQLRTRDLTQETSALAVGTAATYVRSNWQDMLTPVIVAAGRLGAVVQVRDRTGRVVRSSPRFAAESRDRTFHAPVIAGGRTVGSVAVRFGDRGLSGLLARFNRQRWWVRIIGGGVAALLAVAIAVFLVPRITGPLEQLMRAAKARAAGQLGSRARVASGFGDIRQLAATFDQMADVLDRQEQLRRNLVADIAHELRTPVAVMRAETEAILDGFTPGSRADIRSLHEETCRLGRMIDDLQQLAAAEAAAMQLALEPCDLADVAAAAAGSLSGTFSNAGVDLTLRLHETPARCDHARMQDVIRNLLTNAAKYTPAGGSVIVETEPADGRAMLRIADTGVGISAEDLPRVTERFYRGSHAQAIRGSGIGLAVVDELIRAQHGALHIASEPGHGTQVTLTLPGTSDRDSAISATDRINGRNGQRQLPPGPAVPRLKPPGGQDLGQRAIFQ